MRVLFITMGKNTPGARFRCTQFFKYFKEYNVECIQAFGYGDEYNSLHGRYYFKLYQVYGRVRRAVQSLFLMGNSDIIFMQRTCFSFIPLPEAFFFILNKKVIFDFDDAIFLSNQGEESILNSFTFKFCTLRSNFVIAGNKFLLNNVPAQQQNKLVLPTVIDTDQYYPRGSNSSSDHLIIGWMGTASNENNLLLIKDVVIRVLEENSNVIFKIVSNKQYHQFDHPRVKQVFWNKDNELMDLQSFDIGVMPLINNKWNCGKCGFKLIQYLAVGCPVVASGVGANLEIVTENLNGFIANSSMEWELKLNRLIKDEELREKLSVNGRAIAEANYSIKSVIKKYVKIFEDLN